MPQIDGEGFESKLKQVSLQSTCSLLPLSEDGSFFLPLQKGQLNKDIEIFFGDSSQNIQKVCHISSQVLVGSVVTEGFSVGAVENGGVDVKLYINKQSGIQIGLDGILIWKQIEDDSILKNNLERERGCRYDEERELSMNKGL